MELLFLFEAGKQESIGSLLSDLQGEGHPMVGIACQA